MGRVSVHCSGTLTRLCTKGPATSGRSLTSGQWSVTKLFPFYSLSSHSISGFARVCHIQVMLQENANVLLEGKAFPRWPRVETFFHFREVWICGIFDAGGAWNLQDCVSLPRAQCKSFLGIPTFQQCCSSSSQKRVLTRSVPKCSKISVSKKRETKKLVTLAEACIPAAGKKELLIRFKREISTSVKRACKGTTRCYGASQVERALFFFLHFLSFIRCRDPVRVWVISGLYWKRYFWYLFKKVFLVFVGKNLRFYKIPFF